MRRTFASESGARLEEGLMNPVFYSYLACFVNTHTLHVYVSNSYRGLTRRRIFASESGARLEHGLTLRENPVVYSYSAGFVNTLTLNVYVSG